METHHQDEKRIFAAPLLEEKAKLLFSRFIAAFINPSPLSATLTPAFHDTFSWQQEDDYMMNTLKTLSTTSVQIGQDADDYGLRSDMLEPSPRYTPAPPVSVEAGNAPEVATNETASLTNLLPPRMHARVGFNEFLD